MAMHHPPHPGEVLKTLYMEPIGLSITELAERIGVDRKSLSRLINGHTAMTVEMAIRLAQAFDTSAELWLSMQQAHDLWHARKRKTVKARIKAFDVARRLAQAAG